MLCIPVLYFSLSLYVKFAYPFVMFTLIGVLFSVIVSPSILYVMKPSFTILYGVVTCVFSLSVLFVIIGVFCLVFIVALRFMMFSLNWISHCLYTEFSPIRIRTSYSRCLNVFVGSVKLIIPFLIFVFI